MTITIKASLSWTTSRMGIATSAPMAAPMTRWRPTSLDCSMLGFMAISVAITIQSALGSWDPKAIAAARCKGKGSNQGEEHDRARELDRGEGLPGEVDDRAWSPFPRLASHTMPINAIHVGRSDQPRQRLVPSGGLDPVGVGS